MPSQDNAIIREASRRRRREAKKKKVAVAERVESDVGAQEVEGRGHRETAGTGRGKRAEVAEMSESEAERVPSAGPSKKQKTIAEVMAEAGLLSGQRSRSSPRSIHGVATEAAPIDLTVETPPEGGMDIPPESHPEVGEVAASEEQGPVEASPAKNREEPSAVGPSERVRESAEAEPEGSKECTFTLATMAHRGKWAKEFMSQVCPPEVQEDFLKHGSATFFRDASVSMFWAMNTFTALETWFTRADLSISTSNDEAAAAKARADAAEHALEEAKREATAEGERARSAERRADSALSAADGLENRISSLLGELRERENKMAEAEKKASEAEGIASDAKKKASESEAEVEEVKVQLSEAKNKIIEAEAMATKSEEKMIEAEARATELEKKAAEAAAEAVVAFRQSASFKDEIVKGTAYAFDLGFGECKRKMQRLFNVEGMESVEPDEPEGAPSSASDSGAASPRA